MKIPLIGCIQNQFNFIKSPQGVSDLKKSGNSESRKDGPTADSFNDFLSSEISEIKDGEFENDTPLGGGAD